MPVLARRRASPSAAISADAESVCAASVPAPVEHPELEAGAGTATHCLEGGSQTNPLAQSALVEQSCKQPPNAGAQTYGEQSNATTAALLQGAPGPAQ